MNNKTQAIISLALAVAIAAAIAGCSSKSKEPDGVYVSTSQEQTVTTEQSTNDETTATTKKATKSKKAKKVKQKPTKPYYVTNINGAKITTTAATKKVTDKNGKYVTDKNGKYVTEKDTTTASKKNNETTTKHYDGTTCYTTRSANAPIELPALPEDDYLLSEDEAYEYLTSNYPEKWINLFPNYDPNNNGDYAYYAVFTNPDKHTITSIITVDLRTGAANEKNLKTGKVTAIKVMNK